MVIFGATLLISFIFLPMKLYTCREYVLSYPYRKSKLITEVAGIGYGFNIFATGSPAPEGLF